MLSHRGMTLRVGDCWWAKKNISHTKATRLIQILCIKECEGLPCPPHIFGLICYDIEDAVERYSLTVSAEESCNSFTAFSKDAWPKQYMVTNYLQLGSVHTLVRKLDNVEQEKSVCNVRMFDYKTAKIKLPKQIPWASLDGYTRWENRRRNDEAKASNSAAGAVRTGSSRCSAGRLHWTGSAVQWPALHR